MISPVTPIPHDLGQAADAAREPPVKATAAIVQPVVLHTNPVSTIDPALGLVVLQLFNAAGVETQSIPTQRQLAQYRLHPPPQTAA